MTPQGNNDKARSALPTATACAQGEWLDRCRVDILGREPFLDVDDIGALATDLWERPDCQLVTPELAVALLFSDQLRCLSCVSHEPADFSILCSSAATDRCPPKRVALR